MADADSRGREGQAPISEREANAYHREQRRLELDRAQALTEDQHRARFKELCEGAWMHGDSVVRRNNDGTFEKAVTYERYIDPLDPREAGIVSELRLHAWGAGITEAFAPVAFTVTPNLTRQDSRAPTYSPPGETLKEPRKLELFQITFVNPPAYEPIKPETAG